MQIFQNQLADTFVWFTSRRFFLNCSLWFRWLRIDFLDQAKDLIPPGQRLVHQFWGLWLLDKQTLDAEEYLEVTHVVFFATDGNIWWLTHVVAAVKPTYQITTLIDTKHCWRYAVNSNDVSWRNQIPIFSKLIELINLITNHRMICLKCC